MRHALVAAILLAACAEGPSVDDFPRGCDQSELDGDCIEYVGDGYSRSSVETECAMGVVVEACPQGDIGSCRLAEGTPDESRSYFYPRFWMGSQAAQQCASRGGTWTDS